VPPLTGLSADQSAACWLNQLEEPGLSQGPDAMADFDNPHFTLGPRKLFAMARFNCILPICAQTTTSLAPRMHGAESLIRLRMN